jgi:uncharacterized surface protein with fasciclin (FAS1) repeats
MNVQQSVSYNNNSNNSNNQVEYWLTLSCRHHRTTQLNTHFSCLSLSLSLLRFSLIILSGQIACTLPEFSTLCAAVQAADLGGPLSAGEWTVFAPTNDAFVALEEVVGVDLNAVLEDMDVLTNLLLFHAVFNETVMTSDLGCAAGDNLLEMANGRDTRTKCARGGQGAPQRQRGFSNTPLVNEPFIISPDVEACNGVIHVIDQVLLDQTFRDVKPESPLLN